MTQPASLPFGQCLATLFNEKGVLDLTPDMQLASGRNVLAQSLVRRQFTPRGSVITSPNDCIDIRQLISQAMTDAQVAAIGQVIRTELVRDQRVLDAQVTVVLSANKTVATVTENVQSAQGPFTLTITLPGPVVNGQTPNISVVISGQ